MLGFQTSVQESGLESVAGTEFVPGSEAAPGPDLQSGVMQHG